LRGHEAVQVFERAHPLVLVLQQRQPVLAGLLGRGAGGLLNSRRSSLSFRFHTERETKTYTVYY
jgi:hypothetical protein